jgi:small neutral amino acid transporter SnatA (MarC family)
MVPAVIKPIHSLWNEVIGFFFLCFAGIFAIWALRYYRLYLNDPPAEKFADLCRIVGTVFMGLVMAAFGVQGFLRARRISRS